MNISSNISSIQAHQTMMNSSANNVANVNTDGFVPTSTVMSSSDSSVKADVRQSDDTGSIRSQTDLTKEIPDQMIASDTLSVNTTAIQTQDEIMGTLLDIKA
ncbi:MAG: hypothetical protein ABGW74_06595 [Campylobacterales bacterium]